MPRKFELKWRQFAKITIPPFGEFPMDMLRYDACFPARSVDSANMVGRSDEEREVVVARGSETKAHAGWTEGRWKTFGVKIELLEECPPLPQGQPATSGF